jgi:hypothetical protein
MTRYGTLSIKGLGEIALIRARINKCGLRVIKYLNNSNMKEFKSLSALHPLLCGQHYWMSLRSVDEASEPHVYTEDLPKLVSMMSDAVLYASLFRLARMGHPTVYIREEMHRSLDAFFIIDGHLGSCEYDVQPQGLSQASIVDEVEKNGVAWIAAAYRYTREVYRDTRDKGYKDTLFRASCTYQSVIATKDWIKKNSKVVHINLRGGYEADDIFETTRGLFDLSIDNHGRFCQRAALV